MLAQYFSCVLLWVVAAEVFNYPVAWDIRDVVSVDDVAEVRDEKIRKRELQKGIVVKLPQRGSMASVDSKFFKQHCTMSLSHVGID